MVTMRLAEIKGRTVAEIRNDRKVTIPGWTLRREYRSTYRDHLTTPSFKGWRVARTCGPEPRLSRFRSKKASLSRCKLAWAMSWS